MQLSLVEPSTLLLVTPSSALAIPSQMALVHPLVLKAQLGPIPIVLIMEVLEVELFVSLPWEVLSSSSFPDNL